MLSTGHESTQLIFTSCGFWFKPKCRNIVVPAPVIFAGRSVRYVMGLDAPAVGTDFFSFHVSPEGRREKSALSALLSNNRHCHIQPWLSVMHPVISFSEEGKGVKGLRGDRDGLAAALAPPRLFPLVK